MSRAFNKGFSYMFNKGFSYSSMVSQVIEYNKTDIFSENEIGRLVPDLFLFFKKAILEVKASV